MNAPQIVSPQEWWWIGYDEPHQTDPDRSGLVTLRATQTC